MRRPINHHPSASLMLGSRFILRASAFGAVLVLLAFSALERCHAQSADSLARVVLNFPQRETSPDSFYLVIDRDFDAIHHLAKSDTVTLRAGKRHLTVIESTSRDIRISLELAPGDTLRRSVALSPVRSPKARVKHSTLPVLESGSNLYILTDPDTYIYLDNEPSSMGEVLTMSLDSIVTVEARHPELGIRRAQIKPRPDRVAVVELFHRPERAAALRWSALPGGGQFYKRQPVKGAIATGLIMGSLSYGIRLAINVHNANDEYKFLYDSYHSATDELIVTSLGEETERMYAHINNLSDRRNLMLGTAAGLYILSIIDAVIPTRGGFRSRNERRVDWTLSPTIDGFTININL